MAQASTIWHSGAVTRQPVSSFPGGPSLSDMLNTSYQGTFGATKSAVLSVVGATVGSPYVLEMDSVVKARFIALRVVNGASIQLQVTSPAGTLQTFVVSPLLLLTAQNPGGEITAINLVGTADIEVLIAGDVS